MSNWEPRPHRDDDVLTVAVVGCGYWGSKHVRVLSSLDGVEVALVDADDERRDALAKSYPPALSVRDLADALPFIDAAVIATPPSSHAPLAMMCVEAGIDVLVEKPLTTTSADGAALLAKADERGAIVMVGHTFEYNPAVWRLRDVVTSPEFGDIKYIDSARLNLGLYQPDVNVIWDLAPHDISILNYVLGSRPSAVSTWGLNLMSDQADVAYLRLRYDDIDVDACIRVSWIDPMKVRQTTVVGSNSMAVYDDMATEERVRVYDKGVERPSNPAADALPPLTYRTGDIISPYIDFKEPLNLELSDFVAAIRTRQQPATHGQRGLDVVCVLEAAAASLESGGQVPVGYPDRSHASDSAKPTRPVSHDSLFNGADSPTAPAPAQAPAPGRRNWSVLLEASAPETTLVRNELAQALGANGYRANLADPRAATRDVWIHDADVEFAIGPADFGRPDLDSAALRSAALMIEGSAPEGLDLTEELARVLCAHGRTMVYAEVGEHLLSGTDGSVIRLVSELPFSTLQDPAHDNASVREI